MSVTEIIQATRKLSHSDRAKVLDALRVPDVPKGERTVSERQDELHRRLIEEGLLQRIPDLSLRDRNYKPIKIKGKPLSETIIEERR